MNIFENEKDRIVVKSGNNKKSIKNYVDTLLADLSKKDEIKLVGIGNTKY